MAAMGEAGRGLMSLFLVCCVFALVALVHAAENQSTLAPSSSSSSTAAPKIKEKRSQEDIMFGNQQNNPAGGMVDDLFQASETASKNSTPQSTKPTSEHGNDKVGSEQRHTLSELPDRLDYYDYVQTEGSEAMSPSATAEEDDLDEEDVERNSMFVPQDSSSFDTQKVLDENAQIDRSELGDYPPPADDYEPSQNMLYRRRKRGTFRRFWSPHEELLMGPGRSPLRRRRASSGPMRLKRDAASNELLSWLALLHRKPLGGGGRRRNLEDISFQELQGLDSEPLDLSNDPGYLYEQPAEDEEDFEDGDSLPPALLEQPLPLPEEGPNGEALDWDLPIRPAPHRRSFYPLDYRYVLLPGTRKRASIFSAPGGHFGAMREVNRWPGEPQSGRWGHFPLRPTPHLVSPAVRRAPQESDAERLYALASLLAGPPASRDAAELEDRRRRRRSPRAQINRG